MAGKTVVLPAVRNVAILPTAAWMVGDDIVFQFTIVDIAGAVRNITNWNLTWTLRESPNDPDTTLTKVAVITNAAGGVCTVTVAAADTVSLPARRYAHAMRRTDAGSAETVAWGPATLMKGAGA